MKKEFIRGVAKAFWASAFEEVTTELGIDEKTPKVPKAAVTEAKQFALEVEEESGETINALVKAAAKADGVRVSASFSEQLGYHIAQEALGGDASWWDNHEDFDISFPEFEALESIDAVYEWLEKNGYEDTGVTEDTASDVWSTDHETENPGKWRPDRAERGVCHLHERRDLENPPPGVRARGHLTSQERKSLPSSDFGVPDLRGLPIDTPERTRAAMARFNQFDFQSYRQKRRAFHRIVERAEKFHIDSSGFQEKYG